MGPGPHALATELKKSKASCPHARIEHCPLYVASHIAGAGGCVGDLALPCKVKRGLKVYATELARLEREQFDLVARCQWAERHEEAAAQRKRNMKAAGLH